MLNLRYIHATGCFLLPQSLVLKEYWLLHWFLYLHSSLWMMLLKSFMLADLSFASNCKRYIGFDFLWSSFTSPLLTNHQLTRPLQDYFSWCIRIIALSYLWCILFQISQRSFRWHIILCLANYIYDHFFVHRRSVLFSIGQLTFSWVHQVPRQIWLLYLLSIAGLWEYSWTLALFFWHLSFVSYYFVILLKKWPGSYTVFALHGHQATLLINNSSASSLLIMTLSIRLWHFQWFCLLFNVLLPRIFFSDICMYCTCQCLL